MGLPPRWRIQEWAGVVHPSQTAPIVIGGCGSSGTTLVRHILNRHPAIFCGPESTLFLMRITSPEELADRFGFARPEVSRWRRLSRSRIEFIERFQGACLASSGKQLWADKTPENLRFFPEIRRRFPQAKFVHVVRDGRDVACSLRQARWMSLEKITGGADRGSPEALEACIRYWAERVRFARTLAGDPRYHEIRYEDLLKRPEEALKGLTAFLGVPWDPALLEADDRAAERAATPLSRASMGRWRKELTASEARIVQRHAGDLLHDLGYAPDAGWTEQLPATAPVASPSLRGAGAPTPPVRRLLRAAKQLRQEAYTAWFALRDRRFPPAGRVLGLLALLYLVAPIDLIPDRIPVFGYLDDAVALALAGGLVRWLAPPGFWREQRRAAALHLSRHIWAVNPRAAKA
jgi:protein-tyrosine sulfotransferase